MCTHICEYILYVLILACLLPLLTVQEEPNNGQVSEIYVVTVQPGGNSECRVLSSGCVLLVLVSFDKVFTN